MTCSHGIAAGLVLCLAALAWCDEPAPPLLTVEEWIEQLGNRDFKMREKAAKAIEAAGIDALPALRKARMHKDPEIRKRVEAWLPGLERAVLLSPKLVTLHLKNAPLRDAVAAAAKQTGYKLELFADPVREKEVFTFDFDRLPFWEALDRLCEAGGAVAQPSYGDEIIRLHFQDRYAPFVYRHGPFRISGQSLDYGRSIQLATLPRTPTLHDRYLNEYLRFSVSVSVEPRLPLLGLDEPRVLEAYDDQRHPMLPPSANGAPFSRRISHYYGGYRTNTMSTQLSLGTASRGAKLIKQLRGTIPLTLIAEQKELVVSDKILDAKGKKLQVAQLSFDIQDVKEKPNKQYELKMQIVNQAQNGAGDYNWHNSLYYRLQMRDGKGAKFNIFGSSMSVNNGSATVTFTFGRNGAAGDPPTQLVYLDWTTLQHEVPFEFKDLPLP